MHSSPNKKIKSSTIELEASPAKSSPGKSPKQIKQHQWQEHPAVRKLLLIQKFRQIEQQVQDAVPDASQIQQEQMVQQLVERDLRAMRKKSAHTKILNNEEHWRKIILKNKLGKVQGVSGKPEANEEV